MSPKQDPEKIVREIKRKTRRKYTHEFKREAVRQVLDSGQSQTQISLELGVSQNALSRWKKAFLKDQQHAFPGTGRQTPDNAKVRRLQRECKRLRLETVDYS